MIRMSGATDKGLKRKTNQDSVFFDEGLGLGILADGIGGRAGGEVASSLAVALLRKEIADHNPKAESDFPGFLSSRIQKVNLEIMDRGNKEPQVKGMGTTINCLYFVGRKLYLSHVGDSRTYLYQHGNLFQLTLDHNVENFLARGWISPSILQQGTKPEAVVRALGLVPNCQPDIYEIELQKGQIYITCSDGLSGMVSDEEIADIVAKEKDEFDSLPRKLIRAANGEGGRDNVTVLCSKIES